MLRSNISLPAYLFYFLPIFSLYWVMQMCVCMCVNLKKNHKRTRVIYFYSALQGWKCMPACAKKSAVKPGVNVNHLSHCSALSWAARKAKQTETSSHHSAVWACTPEDTRKTPPDTHVVTNLVLNSALLNLISSGPINKSSVLWHVRHILNTRSRGKMRRRWRFIISDRNTVTDFNYTVL